MKKFVLKREYISDVTDTKYMTLNMSDGSAISGMSHARIDHPEFTKLRDMLEQQGYMLKRELTQVLPQPRSTGFSLCSPM
jgi:hypothetical protein